MNVLPNHTRDGHRAHKTHDDDALAFHDLPLRAQRTQKVTNKEFISANSAISAVEFFDDYGRIAGHHDIWLDRLRNDGARGYDRVFADGDAFQDHRIHADPDVVRNFDRSGLQSWAGWSV